MMRSLQLIRRLFAGFLAGALSFAPAVGFAKTSPKLPARFDIVCKADVRQNGRAIADRYSDRMSFDLNRKVMEYYGLTSPVTISKGRIQYDCDSTSSNLLCNTGALIIPAGTYISYDTFTFDSSDGKYQRYFSGVADHGARKFHETYSGACKIEPYTGTPNGPSYHSK